MKSQTCEENQNNPLKGMSSIGNVAEKIGVATHVLRFWETKFSCFSPVKHNGRRYYSSEEIKKIHYIKSLLHDKGMTIKGVQNHLSANGHLSSSGDVKKKVFNQPDNKTELESPKDISQKTLSSKEDTHKRSLLEDVVNDIKKIRDMLRSAVE